MSKHEPQHDRRGGGERGEEEGPLDRFLEALGDFSISVVAGAALAFALIYGLRWRDLHWSWALFALIPVAPLALIDWQSAVALFLGAGAAAVLGFALHRQDIGRGGDEARVARERLGPARYAMSRRQIARAKEDPVKGERLAIGQSADRRVGRIPFGATQGVRGFIPGAPGLGKSWSVAAIATAYVNYGLPVLVADPKQDPELRERLRRAAERAGRRFVEWSDRGGCVYNPLRRGDPSEIADKVLAGERWSEPHYLRQAQRYLGHALRTMNAAGEWPASLQGLVAYLEPARLEALASSLQNGDGEAALAYLDSLAPRAAAELGGVRDRLGALGESEIGRWLDPTPGNCPVELDLVQSMKNGDVVYIGYDADRQPLAAQMLGAAIVGDLVSLTGELQGSPVLGLAVLDEFAAFETDLIARLLSRSRSAGFSIVIATQALADFDVARPEDATQSLVRQLLSQVDFVVAHRTPEPEAADVLAKYAGSRSEWVTTHRVEGIEALFDHAPWGSGTRTRERAFVIHPQVFRDLGVGEAVLIEPAGPDEPAVVRVWPAR